MISTLRDWLRQTGLTRLVGPVVSWAERYRLTRICDYRVEEKSPTEVVFNFGGRQIFLPASNPLFKQMAFSEHERPTTTVFLKYVRQGNTVWDIGANVGYYSCLLAKLTGEAGKVVAFEPNSENFRVLNENIRALHLSNVHSLRTALADYGGEAQMENADRVTSYSRLVAVHWPARQPVRVVSVTTGDAVLKNQNAPLPDFIKVDVEGFEREVLRGLKTVLAHPRCRTLLCEVHFALLAGRGKIGANKDIIGVLRRSGFNHNRWVSRSHLLALKR